MNGITLTLKLGMLDHLIFSKIQLYEEKNYLFSVHDTLGAKLLTHEHKFRHGFNDTINPMCACRTEAETTEHFLLRCHLYSTLRFELFENFEKIDPNF